MNLKEVLIKLKLIDSFETTLPISKTLFIERLLKTTEIGSLSMLSDFSDAFSSRKKEYKGYISTEGFKLKRRKRFFDTNANIAIAEGSMVEKDGNLKILAEVNGFNKFFIFFFIMFLSFIGIILLTHYLTNNNIDRTLGITLTLQTIFVILFPYALMRRSVKRLKYELEREFFYLTKST